MTGVSTAAVCQREVLSVTSSIGCCRLFMMSCGGLRIDKWLAKARCSRRPRWFMRPT
jgi:hypothetical protein